MIIRKNIIFLTSASLVILLLAGFSDISPDHPSTGFWVMEGSLVTHIFKQKTDSLSGPELYELQDEEGLPIWFGRHIYKDVCISGQCKMIRVWLFWDGAGNYLGLQAPEKEPLTKSDHTPFEPEDYKKLDGILGDPASILKSKKQEALIITPTIPNPFEVDGYSAATQPAIADIVVKDAVYTCHTLWHTVYGPVQQEIFEIIENRMDEDYLTRMFMSGNPDYNMWAIGFVESHPEYQDGFQQHILNLVASDNEMLARNALKYFESSGFEDVAIQMGLSDAMLHAQPGIKNNILWMFIGYNEIDTQVILNLLKLFEKEVLGIGDYNLILKLINPEQLDQNEELLKSLKRFLSHDNAYIRGLTERFLKER